MRTAMRFCLFEILVLIAFLSHCTSVGPRLESPEQQKRMARLGRELFFDSRLSSDGKLSCASCHKPELAFTNGERVATGVHGRKGDRNVPTLLNRAGTLKQFWDMRADSLEHQVGLVLSAENEMGAVNLDEVAERIEAVPGYQESFKDVFGEKPTPKNLAMALAAFERTLHSGEAPYDRYVAGDVGALSADAIHGKDLFFKKFRCDSCHSGPNFADEKLRVRCYPSTSNITDFIKPNSHKNIMVKTPTLRNLIYTAPYMHTGALSTLEEVVEFYSPSFRINAAGEPDPSLPIVKVTAAEKRQLVAFLKSLSAPKPFVEVEP